MECWSIGQELLPSSTHRTPFAGPARADSVEYPGSVIHPVDRVFHTTLYHFLAGVGLMANTPGQE
jgi:hypothetical protein